VKFRTRRESHRNAIGPEAVISIFMLTFVCLAGVGCGRHFRGENPLATLKRIGKHELHAAADEVARKFTSGAVVPMAALPESLRQIQHIGRIKRLDFGLLLEESGMGSWYVAYLIPFTDSAVPDGWPFREDREAFEYYDYGFWYVQSRTDAVTKSGP